MGLLAAVFYEVLCQQEEAKVSLLVFILWQLSI